jgi:hypothetical protein
MMKSWPRGAILRLPMENYRGTARLFRFGMLHGVLIALCADDAL